MMICVCEDDLHQLDYLLGFLYKHTDNLVHQYIGFGNPKELLDYAANYPVDIIVMDVNLGNYNGVEIVNQIHRMQPNMQVIFITGDYENRSLVYEANHIYYLDKPVKEELLLRAIHKAINSAEAYQLKATPQLVIQNQGVQTVINFSDIVYLESKGRILHIYTAEGKLKQTYRSLSSAIALLDERFLHCHKSYVVNMDYIKKCINKKTFQMNLGNVEIPISQTKSNHSYQRFLQYIGQ